MFAYLPCANDPAIVPAPSVHDKVILLINMPQSPYTYFAVIVALVRGLDYWITEDADSNTKIYLMVFSVSARLPVFSRWPNAIETSHKNGPLYHALISSPDSL